MTAQIAYDSFKELELSSFIITPTLYLEAVPNLTLFTAAAEGTSWSVREAKGRIQGVGASVSGLGAYARVNGSMSFSTSVVDGDLLQWLTFSICSSHGDEL